ncbi:hypothetical protein SAY87_002002 [Trapa incisa]|uniref:Uncharacterized protein n=1 Tax=Trapa incisa TaxID=236973 RepID=A0AAN7JTF3_9MYRT|nr:hypothetical protein SAY87_002002 [Trapa incisa]
MHTKNNSTYMFLACLYILHQHFTSCRFLCHLSKRAAGLLIQLVTLGYKKGEARDCGPQKGCFEFKRVDIICNQMEQVISRVVHSKRLATIAAVDDPLQLLQIPPNGTPTPLSRALGLPLPPPCPHPPLGSHLRHKTQKQS